MIKRTFIISMVLGLVLVFGSTNSFAAKYEYKGGAAGSGSLSGAVSYDGPLKDVEIDYSKSKNAEFCATHPDTNKDGKTRTDHQVVVNGGKLKDAIVTIENISEGKDWPVETVNVDWKMCDIQPRMFPVRKTTKAIKKAKSVSLLITNHDEGVIHNPHGYNVLNKKKGKSATLFNLALPKKGATVNATVKGFNKFKYKLKKDGSVKRQDKHFFLQCDNHNFMIADGRVVWNPYYSVTGGDGSYKIDGVPDGKYQVCAWHPYAGKGNKDEATCQDVEIKGATKANFAIK